MEQEQARRLKNLLAGHLVPKRVDILPAGACVASGRICFLGKWRAHSPRSCPHRGRECKDSLHDSVCRSVIAAVYSVDPSACVLPEFPVGFKRRGADGRFKAGPSHVVDLLVVLSNDQVVAIEVDGDSHHGALPYSRDADKDYMFLQRRVMCHRVNIRKCNVYGCGDRLKNEIHAVRDLIHQMM